MDKKGPYVVLVYTKLPGKVLGSQTKQKRVSPLAMSQLSNRRDPNAALRNRMHGGPPSNRSYGSESYRRYSGGGRGGYEPHKQHNNGVCERLDPKSVPKSKPTFPRTPERIPEAEYDLVQP